MVSGLGGLGLGGLTRYQGPTTIAAVGVTFTASAVSATDAASYTFSAAALGTASPGRKIVVGVGFRAGTDIAITSLTIGGVAATVITGTALDFSPGNLSAIALYQATVPTGTTGDIVVTLNGAALRCGIGVWALTNASAVVDTGTSVADPATKTLTIPARGAGIGYAFQTDTGAALTATWTGLTENFDATVEGFNSHNGASVTSAAPTALAVACDWNTTPATGGAATFASFG